MSTLKVNNIKDASGGTSNLKIDGAAKAWVNFDGTGTVTIRDDLNVSSITDNGTGNYTTNFTSAMANDDYAAICGYQASSSQTYVVQIVSQATGSVRHSFLDYANGAALDQSIVNIAVFGD